MYCVFVNELSTLFTICTQYSHAVHILNAFLCLNEANVGSTKIKWLFDFKNYAIYLFSYMCGGGG